MSARFLAWYTAGAFGLAALGASAITLMPGDEWFRRVLLLSFIPGAAVFALLGIVLRAIPEAHWCNRSRAVRVTLSVAAVVASLLLLTSVG